MRASAVNKNGEGAFSDPQVTAAYVLVPPLRGSTPEPIRFSHKVNSYRVRWNYNTKDLLTPVTSYTLKYSNVTQTVNQTLSEYPVVNLIPDKVYNIRLRANNVCGSGKYSAPLVAKTPTVPKQARVIMKTEKCHVVIMWAAPDNGGYNITEYKVDIRGKSGEFYTVEGCGTDPSVRNCTV